MAAIKKYDTFIAILFAGLIMLFIAVAFTTPSFWDWLWQRHHNQLELVYPPVIFDTILLVCLSAELGRDNDGDILDLDQHGVVCPAQ